MRLRVVHHTRYLYQSPVVVAQHVAHLQPRTLPGQQLLDHTLQVAPEPLLMDQNLDTFGNVQTFFSLQSPHDTLDVTSSSLLLTEAGTELDDSHGWETVRDRLQYRAHAPYEPSTEFVFPSPYVPRHEAFADYARPFFKARRPFLDACHDLMAHIHADFEYQSASTEVNTPALEALKQKRGVCQDFAHIMIACLRSLGLPARYVSGYLLTQPPPGKPRLVGADASHAWVSVPHEDHWVDFDPTNNRCGVHRAGEDYVTVAHGRDFGDVSPLRGVIQGGGTHRLEVAVTVAPEAEWDTLSTQTQETSA
jgi:transglutaminase-like putative cysteine protease